MLETILLVRIDNILVSSRNKIKSFNLKRLNYG